MQSHRLHFRGRRKRWRSWACSRSKSEWHAVIGGAILRKKHTSEHAPPAFVATESTPASRYGDTGGVTRYPVACTRKVRYYTSAKRRSAYPASTLRHCALRAQSAAGRAGVSGRWRCRRGARPAGRPGPRPRRVSGLAQRPASSVCALRSYLFDFHTPVPGRNQDYTRRSRSKRDAGVSFRDAAADPSRASAPGGGGATRLIAPKGSLHSPVAVCW